MKIDNFFTELKRRNVIRAAGLYLVGAWLVTQVASTVLPMFDVPSWALRGLIVTLALGFIPAVIFSWVFELTPEGLKRDEDVPADQSIAPQTGRHMDRMIIVVLVLALAYFAVDKFLLNPRREKSAARTSSSESQATPNEKSVAVLAFDNLSDDKGSEYFSDGISEELLTVLQKIPGLHVAARTSAFSFKGKNATAQEIGAETRRGTFGRGKCAQGRRRRAHCGPPHSGQHGRRAMVGKLHAQFEGCLRRPNRARPNHRRTVARSAHRWRGQSDSQGGDSSRRCRRRKKAERKTSRRMKLICRAAFFLIATPKKRQIKPGPLLNARWSWIPSSRSRGRGWPRLTSGIAIMPPRAARKASTLIWPLRARRWNEPSPSNPTCRKRCFRGR